MLYFAASVAAAAWASTRDSSALGWSPSRLTSGPNGCADVSIVIALNGAFVLACSYSALRDAVHAIEVGRQVDHERRDIVIRSPLDRLGEGLE